MAAYSKKEKITLDTDRGITSVARFEKDVRKRLTQEQLLNAANDDKETVRAQKATLEQAQREAEDAELHAIEEDIRRRQQAQLRQAEHTQTAQANATIAVMNRPLIIGVLSMLAFYQCIFAVCAAVGIGLEASRDAACSETTMGQIVCSTASVFNDFFNFFGVDLSIMLPFEMISYGFWALNLTLTIGVFLVVTFIEWSRNHRHSRMMGSTNAMFVTVLCIAFNITPILNFFPWIEMWGAYWLLGGRLFGIRGLSRVRSKN